MKISVNNEPWRSQTPTLPPPRSAEKRTLSQRLAAALMMTTDDNEQMALYLLGCVRGDTLALDSPTQEQALCVESMSHLAWELLDLASKEQGEGGIEVVVLGDGIMIGALTLDGMSVLDNLHTLIVPSTCEITDDLREAVSKSCPSIVRLQAGGQLEIASPMHIHAAEFLTRARSACELLSEALDEECSDIGSAAVQEALNSLIELAPHLAIGNVDKLLVGFLQACITNRRERYLDDYVNTIVAARPGQLDTEHMDALLCGRSTPVAPADWHPQEASASPSIVNFQGAHLSASQYRGMPALLHRLLVNHRRADRDALASMARTEPPRADSRPVLPADRRMYAGIKVVIQAVMSSNGLSHAERTAFWLSSYGAAQRKEGRHVASELTLMETAMLKDHVGAAAAMLDALINSDVEWPLKWHLVDLQRVNLRDIACGLRGLEGLPNHEWAGDALMWVNQLISAQEARLLILQKGPGPT